MSKMRRFFNKKLIRKISIFNKSSYPNYCSLLDIASLIIETKSGEFVFKIKEDVKNKWYSSNKRRRHRFYTVELFPAEFATNTEKYSDKLMLAVKTNIVQISKENLVYCLIDVYLDNIGREVVHVPLLN